MSDKLGFTFTDKITGFEGLCTGHVQYLSGCNQMLLTPRVGPDGAMRSAEWFDEQRCQKNPAHVVPVTLDNSTTPGFDKPAPKR